MTFIPVDDSGTTLFVEDTAGEGKPVFFVHGWPLEHRMFESQFLQMHKDGYRCIGIDLRGFGMSAKPWQGYSYDVFADDIQRVMNVLNLDQKFAMVGFSMGGAVVMRYIAKYYPKDISEVVFMGAAAPSFTKREGYPHGHDKAFCDGIIAGAMTNRPKTIAEFGKLLFSKPDAVGPEMASWLFRLSMEASPLATIKAAEALRDSDLQQDMFMVSERNLPVAIFHGSLDKVCPFDFAKVLNQGIKGSKLVHFDKSGHALNIEEMQKTNQELEKFIRQGD